MRKFLLLFLLSTAASSVFAQFKGQVPEPKKYDPAKVVDPDYGITMYEKLNFQTGGDSVRNDRKGYACQGWVEDYYEGGQLLHKGYYEDGHLKIYKNYFPNGNVERTFKINDFKRCTMQLFFDDNKPKSDINYFEGSPQIWTDYYHNGQIEYFEENTKSMEYLISRRSFTQDGKPQELFELTNPKKKIYSKKEYYENGKIKAEGEMIYIPNKSDYVKDGSWTIYDEQGKSSKEKWVKGEEIK
ncbi:MAG: hypothetical protein WCP52_09720 [Bacteroidota bacterium]